MAIVNGTDAGEMLNGTPSADTINAFGGNDWLKGGGGDDSLKGGGGADILDGGAGIDTASYVWSPSGVRVSLQTGQGFGGDAQGDTLINIENLVGSSFDDSLTGDGGNNELIGYEGNDFLIGGDGADRLSGDNGNDYVGGGGGGDVLDGGAGFDFADYHSSPVGVFISLITSTAAYGDAEGDTLSGIEGVVGSDQADNLWGDDGVNWLHGAGGNDTLKGFGGDDFLTGGDGADQLFGMNGYDTMFGYDGADTLDGGAGDDYLDGGPGADVLRGGIGGDSYVVDTAADVVTEARGEGSDIVFAQATYALAAGSEVEVLQAFDTSATTALDLIGNEFNNTIIGNNGGNIIAGGLGQDTLTGLGGPDVFVWFTTAETKQAGDQADVITDFDPASGDRIDVLPIDANEMVAGDQAFTFVGVVDFASSFFTGPGQIGYFTSATDTFILLNTRVDPGGVDFEEATIRLSGVHTPDASWFIL